MNIGAFIGQGSIRSEVIGSVNRAATAEEIEIPLPGRSALSDRSLDLERSGKDRWIRLQIPVVVHDGHFRVPT